MLKCVKIKVQIKECYFHLHIQLTSFAAEFYCKPSRVACTCQMQFFCSKLQSIFAETLALFSLCLNNKTGENPFSLQDVMVSMAVWF